MLFEVCVKFSVVAIFTFKKIRKVKSSACACDNYISENLPHFILHCMTVSGSSTYPRPQYLQMNTNVLTICDNQIAKCWDTDATYTFLPRNVHCQIALFCKLFVIVRTFHICGCCIAYAVSAVSHYQICLHSPHKCICGIHAFVLKNHIIFPVNSLPQSPKDWDFPQYVCISCSHVWISCHRAKQ